MPLKNPRSRFPLPDVINPEQRRCVTFEIPDNLIHIGNFWGAIEKLGQWNAYEYDVDKTGKEVAAVWRGVIEQARIGWLANECGGELEEGDCFTFEPWQSIIQWSPTNPFTDPDIIPTGYLKPPFHVVNDDDTLLHILGLQNGDVYNDLTHFPPGSLPTILPPDGLPRFRVHFSGTDDENGVTVELHFVKIPAGGRILISVDGQILDPPLVWFDLNRDLLSIPPETTISVVEEVKVMGTGNHFIDVTWLPTVNEEAPFLYFGGALRKVVICGEDFPLPMAEMEFVDCVIRFRPSPFASWQEFDITNCVKGIVDGEIEQRLEDGELGGSQPGGQGNGPEPYFCQTYHVTLHGNQKWLAPIPIKAGYTITVTNATGAANGGSVNWYCPSGEIYGLGQCGGVVSDGEVTDPMPTNGHMRLIMQYDSSFYDAYNVEHQVSGALTGSRDLEFQVNDGVLSDNAGDYQFDLEICNQGACAPSFQPEDKNTVDLVDGVYTVECHTVNPDANGAYQLVIGIGDLDGSPCECKAIEIVSLTGYTLPDAEDPFNGGAVYECNTGFIVNEHGTGQNWATFYNGLTNAQKCDAFFDIKSQTPFTIVFRFIDCP